MRYKVLFDNQDATQHVYAVKRMLERLDGVEVLHKEIDEYIIEVSEDTVHIIDDMNLYGYIKLDKFIGL